MLVDRAVGGSSIMDGQIELMLHRFLYFYLQDLGIMRIRELWFCMVFLNYIMLTSFFFFFLKKNTCRRLLRDDSRGVAEALNERVCVLDTCQGLTVSGAT